MQPRRCAHNPIWRERFSFHRLQDFPTFGGRKGRCGREYSASDTLSSEEPGMHRPRVRPDHIQHASESGQQAPKGEAEFILSGDFG